MPQVLYRKYRSQNFGQLYGQDAVKNILTQALKDKRVAHAYLFSGPRGTGKTSTARILAKALNCISDKKNTEFEPCDKCPNCLSINSGKYLDLVEIDAASNRGIDEIRSLKEKIGFLPVEGVFKVYIIDEVHMLTQEAFNALLKTLEEPPKNVIFILATTEAHKIPLTIISRTQRLDFKLANETDLLGKIKFILKEEGIKYEDDALKLITRAGNGSFRDSETVLEKVLATYGYEKDKIINKTDVEKVLGMVDAETIKHIFDFMQAHQTEEALTYLNNLLNQGTNPTELLRQFLEFARKEMLLIVGGEKSNYSLTFITNSIKTLNQAGNDMNTALISTLPLELAIVNLALSTVISKPVNQVIKIEKNIPKIKEKVVQNIEDKTSTDKIVSTVNLNISEIRDKWHEIIEKSKKFNHHLAAFLIEAKPDSLEGETLGLIVPFAFHKKSLEMEKTQKVFQGITKDLLGVALTLKCKKDSTLVSTSKREVESVEEESNKDIVEEIFSEEF